MDSANNRRSWAERSGEFSPTYYAELGPNRASRSLVSVLDRYAPADPAVLEIGCSSGRHLAHLRENGFGDLTGVDINGESFEVMAEYFPALAETGTFHTGAIEDVLPGFPDGAFDVVYSVETLQHVHPDDAWVFEDFARATSDLLVTVENEGADPDRERAEGDEGERVSYVRDEFPLYHRDWGAVFTDLGLEQVYSKPGKRDTIRVFRTP